MARVVFKWDGEVVLAPSTAEVMEVPGSSRTKPHILVDGVEFKHCSSCDTWRRLSKFSRSSLTWDGLQGFCDGCHSIIAAEKLSCNREVV